MGVEGRSERADGKEPGSRTTNWVDFRRVTKENRVGMRWGEEMFISSFWLRICIKIWPIMNINIKPWGPEGEGIIYDFIGKNM